jgi:hypothetical protein
MMLLSVENLVLGLHQRDLKRSVKDRVFRALRW